MVKKLIENPKKTKQKKAQMKIQQMSFMLIAVFIFFALVGMVVVSVLLNNMQRDATSLKEENAMLLASRIANSPELSCGKVYDKERTNCIDLDKAMVLLKNKEKYKKFWGVASLEIIKTYPKLAQPNNEIECTPQNYPNCNLITLVNNSETPDRYSYVALCRKEIYKGESVNKCELGIIVVGYEGIQ